MKTGLVKENTGQRPPELYHIDKEKYLTSLIEDVKRGQWASEQREAIIRQTAEADGQVVEMFFVHQFS